MYSVEVRLIMGSMALTSGGSTHLRRFIKCVKWKPALNVPNTE